MNQQKQSRQESKQQIWSAEFKDKLEKQGNLENILDIIQKANKPVFKKNPKGKEMEKILTKIAKNLGFEEVINQVPSTKRESQRKQPTSQQPILLTTTESQNISPKPRTRKYFKTKVLEDKDQDEKKLFDIFSQSLGSDRKNFQQKIIQFQKQINDKDKFRQLVLGLVKKNADKYMMEPNKINWYKFLKNYYKKNPKDIPLSKLLWAYLPVYN